MRKTIIAAAIAALTTITSAQAADSIVPPAPVDGDAVATQGENAVDVASQAQAVRTKRVLVATVSSHAGWNSNAGRMNGSEADSVAELRDSIEHPRGALASVDTVQSAATWQSTAE